MNMDKMSSVRILNHYQNVYQYELNQWSTGVCVCVLLFFVLLNRYVMYWTLSRFSIQASLNIWHNWDDQPNKSIGEPIYNSRHSFFSFHLTHLVWLFGINFQVFLSILFVLFFHFSSSHCLQFKCDMWSMRAMRAMIDERSSSTLCSYSLIFWLIKKRNRKQLFSFWKHLCYHRLISKNHFSFDFL